MGANLPTAEGKGVWVRRWAIFVIFSTKITRFMHILAKIAIKAITHQLKTLEKQSKRTINRINEVQVL